MIDKDRIFLIKKEKVWICKYGHAWDFWLTSNGLIIKNEQCWSVGKNPPYNKKKEQTTTGTQKYWLKIQVSKTKKKTVTHIGWQSYCVQAINQSHSHNRKWKQKAVFTWHITWKPGVKNGDKKLKVTAGRAKKVQAA